jgi:hypothetical protein
MASTLLASTLLAFSPAAVGPRVLSLRNRTQLMEAKEEKAPEGTAAGGAAAPPPEHTSAKLLHLGWRMPSGGSSATDLWDGAYPLHVYNSLTRTKVCYNARRTKSGLA